MKYVAFCSKMVYIWVAFDGFCFLIIALWEGRLRATKLEDPGYSMTIDLNMIFLYDPSRCNFAEQMIPWKVLSLWLPSNSPINKRHVDVFI